MERGCRPGVTGDPRTRDMCDTGVVFVTEVRHRRTPVSGRGVLTSGLPPVSVSHPPYLVSMSGQNIDRAPRAELETVENQCERAKSTAKGTRWRTT